VESEPELRIERLYADVSGGDAVNVRLGKFQTPVGIWNLVPAEPFTWTATNPVLVEAAFDEHQTGAALFGSFFPGRTTVEYWVYGQFVDPFDVDKEDEPADRSIGGRLRVAGARNEWALGGSCLVSSKDGEWSTLGGVDFSWARGPLEVQGEMAAVRGDIRAGPVVVYVQAVYGLGAHARWLRGLRRGPLRALRPLGPGATQQHRQPRAHLDPEAVAEPEGRLPVRRQDERRRQTRNVRLGVRDLLAWDPRGPERSSPGRSPRQASPAADLAVIVHAGRQVSLTPSDLARIYLKQRRHWPDGDAILPVNREAGSEARRLFERRVLGDRAGRLVVYWNQQYFRGVLPPATLASDEAVLRFVAGEPRAIGYVAAAPWTAA
jgi:hypothetical protein